MPFDTEIQHTTDPDELRDLLMQTEISGDPTVDALHEACIALAVMVKRQQRSIDKLRAALDEQEGRAIAKAEGRRYE